MKIKKNLILKIVGVVIIATAFALGGYYFATKKVADSKDTQKQLQEAVEKVSKLMLLPTDETPTLATVTDIKKLEGQPFFAHAEVGDEILIYTNSKKVILYSPSKNKIIEVGGVNLSGSQQ